jgi:predicted regulator of Ras-like GTPase activity (Roadblock/LC7/MglB family)
LVPYQAILEDLLRSARVEGALLLDSTGELVLAAGANEHRHRLIGAYQGIVLGQALRLAGRHALGALQYMLWRHGAGAVIVRPLKDGYYLVVHVAEGRDVARCLHRTRAAQQSLNDEL